MTTFRICVFDFDMVLTRATYANLVDSGLEQNREWKLWILEAMGLCPPRLKDLRAFLLTLNNLGMACYVISFQENQQLILEVVKIIGAEFFDEVITMPSSALTMSESVMDRVRECAQKNDIPQIKVVLVEELKRRKDCGSSQTLVISASLEVVEAMQGGKTRRPLAVTYLVPTEVGGDKIMGGLYVPDFQNVSLILSNTALEEFSETQWWAGNRDSLSPTRGTPRGAPSRERVLSLASFGKFMLTTLMRIHEEDDPRCSASSENTISNRPGTDRSSGLSGEPVRGPESTAQAELQILADSSRSSSTATDSPEYQTCKPDGNSSLENDCSDPKLMTMPAFRVVSSGAEIAIFEKNATGWEKMDRSRWQMLGLVIQRIHANAPVFKYYFDQTWAENSTRMGCIEGPIGVFAEDFELSREAAEKESMSEIRRIQILKPLMEDTLWIRWHGSSYDEPTGDALLTSVKLSAPELEREIASVAAIPGRMTDSLGPYASALEAIRELLGVPTFEMGSIPQGETFVCKMPCLDAFQNETQYLLASCNPTLMKEHGNESERTPYLIVVTLL